MDKSASKKTSTTKAKPRKSSLKLIKNDPWLEPYTDAIEGRHADAMKKEKELTGEAGSLNDFANAHQYFGLHRNADGSWVFREWAPNASAITLIGDFSDWKEMAKYRLKSKPNGVWELKLKPDALRHGQLYKMMVRWPGGEGTSQSRVKLPSTSPSWTPRSKSFSGCLEARSPRTFTHIPTRWPSVWKVLS